jgi:hypothetical protein
MKVQYFGALSPLGVPTISDVYISFQYHRKTAKALNRKGEVYNKIKKTTAWCFINVCDPFTHEEILFRSGIAKQHKSDVFDKEIARKYSLFRALGGTLNETESHWDFSNSPLPKDLRKTICDAYFDRPRGKHKPAKEEGVTITFQPDFLVEPQASQDPRQLSLPIPVMKVMNAS